MIYTRDQLLALQPHGDSIICLAMCPRSERVGILLRDSLKRETHLRFQVKSFENYQQTFESVDISVRVAIIYRLYTTKKNCLKTADFFKECSGFVDSHVTNCGYLMILGDLCQTVPERPPNVFCAFGPMPTWLVKRLSGCSDKSHFKY